MLSSKLSHLSLTKPDFLSSLKFQSCLGQGGFGIVFKAVDANPSTSFLSPPSTTAVKFIFPEESNDKEEQQIIRECTLASKFNHKNVVQILTVAVQQLGAAEIEKIFENVPEDDDRLQTLRDTFLGKARRKKTIESICIQMQLCGDNLRRWLQQGHDPNSKVTQSIQNSICHGIVSGLKYLHDNKIVHRDLKPENVMFSHEKFKLPVKIGDFGLCRTIHSAETQTNTLTSRAGTQDYMAPEAFTNDYSYQADLFSLGLVIWEVFQFIPFHERKTLFDKLVNDKKEDLVAEMSATGVREVVLNLTRRNKVDRTQSVDEIVGIFESVRTSEELGIGLRNAVNGEAIVLGDGVYKGEFVLEQDNVDIVGGGSEKTVLKGLKNKTCLEIRGSGCTISDIQVISENGYRSIAIDVIGSRNTIRNVEASEGLTQLRTSEKTYTTFHAQTGILRVCAESNRLENLTIYDAENAIVLEGSGHIVDHVKMDNIYYGIHIDSGCNQNVISNITGTSAKYGIWVAGSSNNFHNINLVKQNSSNGFCGMQLYGNGSNNNISNLTCSGYSRNSDDWGLNIDLPDTAVKDSECGPVWVWRRNANLTNVDCGEEIKIRENATGVILEDCRGQELKLRAPRQGVTIINCHFDKITPY